jgi:hypothetical protein
VIVVRRRVWLAVVAIAAAAIALPVTAVLGLVLPSTGGLRTEATCAIGLWLAFTAAHAIAVQVGQR